jgi:hypothetical protein
MRGYLSPICRIANLSHASRFFIFLISLYLFQTTRNVNAQNGLGLENSAPEFRITESPMRSGISPDKPVAAFLMDEKAMGKAAVIDPVINSEESDTFEIGCEFIVEFPITVTELGFYDMNDDGLSGVSTVTIWNINDRTAIVTAEIPEGIEANLIDGFRYVNVTDTRLQAGKYIMSAYSGGQGYGMNSGLTAQTGNGISLTAGVFNTQHGYPSHHNYSFGFFGANFLYTSNEPAVTDPGAVEEFTGNWELGCSFTVNTPILVTHLGTYDTGLDGLANNTPVTIWKVSDQSVVASCVVPAGDTAFLINNFRYSKIIPFYLEPGQYRMSSYFVNDGFAVNFAASSVSVPEITLTGGAYAASHSCPVSTIPIYYFGANFLFSTPLSAIINPQLASQNTGTWELGYEFNVVTPITIVQLGSFDSYDNGLAAQAIVTLWNTSDQSVILRDTIPAGISAPLINGFRYTDVTDITLQPGTYRISSYFAGGEYGWSSVSSVIPEIHLIRGVYSSSQGYPGMADLTYYFGPNMLLKQSCAAADLPVIDGSPLICSGESAELSIVAGNLNESEHWQWYLDSCDGSWLGTGNSIEVNPLITQSFFLRGEGNCLNTGPCAKHTVEVTNSVSIRNEGNTLISDITGDSYQWVDCNDGDALISGETGQSYKPEQSGNYAVIVTLGECLLESNCFQINITALTQRTFEPEISAFPNPVQNILTLDLPEGYESVDIHITDLQGKVIPTRLFGSVSTPEIDFSECAPGIYFLWLRSLGRMTILKIFKQ